MWILVSVGCLGANPSWILRVDGLYGESYCKELAQGIAEAGMSELLQIELEGWRLEAQKRANIVIQVSRQNFFFFKGGKSFFSSLSLELIGKAHPYSDSNLFYLKSTDLADNLI